MRGNSLGISIKQRTKQYSKGEQLSPSAFAISRIPTCQKVSLWTKTEGFSGLFIYREIARKMREIKPKTPKSGKQQKEKSLKNVVFSRLFMAEGKGFEPLWAGAQTVFKNFAVLPDSSRIVPIYPQKSA